MRRLLWVPLVILLPLMTACALEGDASSPAASPTPAARLTPTPARGTPPVFARPPAATAAAGGVTVTMGIGTYCWSAPGSNGICVDAAGPVTGTEELPVKPGERVEVTTEFPGSEIREAVASAIAVDSTQGKPINTGELVWNFPPIRGQQQPPTLEATGISFAAPNQPGRYVVSLFLRPGAGDVAYGVVLDVR